MRRREFLASAGAVAAAGVFAPEAAAAPVRFPDRFLWGTATSAYQVEGRAGRRGACIWDTFCRRPGAIADGSNGGIACDSVHRYPEDVALIAGAGLKAYRFSVAWARVLPAGSGQPDPAGLDYYSRLVDALHKAGVEPWLCLYHWDLPQALQDRGGWTGRPVADRFADYAELIARRLGDRVVHWLTLNEPNVHAVLGHGLGQHAPGLKGRAPMFAAFHHQNLAHGSGVLALRAVGGARFRIGTALSLAPVRPVGGAAANVAAARMWDAVWNRAVLDPMLRGHYPQLLEREFAPLVRAGDLTRIRQRLDFVGVNYYSPMYQRADPHGLVGTNWGAMPAGMGRTKLDWPVDPNGLVEVLADLHDHYGSPRLYITENGACYADHPGRGGRVDDRRRIAYLREHVAAARRALGRGADLHGYFAWTIIDNFEWAYGYTAPFGLVRVDRTSLRRSPKASYDWFAGVARSNGL